MPKKPGEKAKSTIVVKQIKKAGRFVQAAAWKLATVKSYMRDILREIGKVLNEVENKVALTGHTDSAPYTGGQRSYSNWELSADRANASRREL